jgi:sugar O-acyltransferase (sialic acid O-acetyltransferase NeuD family)
MNDLILVAASGLAREAMEAIRAQGKYTIVGIADDNPGLKGHIIHGVPVVGGLNVLATSDAAVLLCVGKGSVRQRIAGHLGFDESRYATVIHPSVHVPSSCTVGSGSIVLAGCVLTASVLVGQHVVLMPNVTLTHDDVIGDFATLCASVTLGGSVQVEAAAYVGMAASVRENCRIGSDATIGMGAVVVNDVPAGQTWLGVPARRQSAKVAIA